MKGTRSIILTAALFVCSTGFSQNKEQIDSINDLDYTYISNNLNLCRQLFEKNSFDARKIKYSLGEANALDKLGLTYSLLGSYDHAVKQYIDAVKIFEKHKKYDKIAGIYGSIGFRVKYIDYDKALYYFRLAIQIGEKNKIGADMEAIYNNYGEVLAKEKPDSALFFYKKSLRIARKYKNTIGIPFSLNNMAVEYARRRQFKKAFATLDLSDKYRFRGNDESGKADNIAYRADIFYEIPNVDSAIFYYEKSLKLAQQTKYNNLERYCLEHLSDLYQRKGNFEHAYRFLKRFKSLEDTALNGTVKSQLASLQVEYETERTQRELAEEKARVSEEEKINSKNALKLEARKKWMIFIVGLLLVLLLLFFFVYRYQKAKRLSEVKEMDLNKQLETSKLENEFAEEKIRIARELHDNIGSHLTFMISSLDNLSYLKNPDQKLEKINDLSNFGRLTMKDLRDTIWAMNHDGGSFEQLVARISELRSVLPADLEVSIKSGVDNLKPLNGLQLLNCYRIVQEFIQNTIKYAEASGISIQIDEKASDFLLCLQDNGKGFDLMNINFGNGISNMKRRCEDLNGIFSISSGKEGTMITCKIPYI